MIFLSKNISFYLKNKSLLNENSFINVFLLSEFYKKITDHNNIIMNRQFKLSLYYRNSIYKLKKHLKKKKIRILFRKRVKTLKKLNLIKLKLNYKTKFYNLRKYKILNSSNILKKVEINSRLLKFSFFNFNKKLNVLRFTNN